MNDSCFNHAMLFPRVNRLVLKNLEEVEVGTSMIRFSCDTPIVCKTEISIPQNWLEMIGSKHLILQPGCIFMEDGRLYRDSQIFVIELNSPVKYQRNKLKIVTDGVTIRSCAKNAFLFHLGPSRVWGLPATQPQPLSLGRWLELLPCLGKMG